MNISGSGGGGKGRSSRRIPVNAPNTIQTNVAAKTVWLLSEGEVEGLANETHPGNSVYLDDTPILDKDGNSNFEGVSFEFRPGSPNQAFMPGFDKIASEVLANQQIKQSSAVNFTVVNREIDEVVVKINFPEGLRKQNKKTGDIDGTKVGLRVSINDNKELEPVVAGKAGSSFDRSYRFSIPDKSIDTKFTLNRLTKDHDEDLTIQDKTFFKGYTEIIDQKITYADSAVISLTIDAKASGLSSLPLVSVRLRGIKTIEVPVNYDPVTRKYTGIWNGTFKKAYTNNPAWVLYNMITNSRYGLGDYVDRTLVDKFGLFVIAQYCDELVSDGMGGMEPRFTFNTVIENRMGALRLLRLIGSCARISIFYGGESLKFFQDSPADMTSIYNATDVMEDKFLYQSGAYSKRINTVVATFNDPKERYRQSLEIVEDLDAISKIGERKAEITAYGCTSRGQAHRLAKSVFLTDKFDKTVVFNSGLKTIFQEVGNVTGTNDPSLALLNTGGRIVYVSGKEVKLSNKFDFQNGLNYFIIGTSSDLSIEEIQISNPGINTDIIQLIKEFTKTIETGASYIIKTPALSPKLWRIVGINYAKDFTHSIKAVEYNASKYDAIDKDLNLQIPPDSIFKEFDTRRPSNIGVTTRLIVKDNTVTNGVLITWDVLPTAVSYRYQLSINDRGFSELEGVSGRTVDLEGDDGTWTFRVKAVDFEGRETQFGTLDFPVSKADIAVGDVKNFRGARDEGGTIFFNWDHTISDGLAVTYILKKGNQDTNPTWNQSTFIDEVSGNNYVMQLRAGGAFLIKAKSVTGALSKNAATTLVFGESKNTALTRDEKALVWPGTKVNFVVDGSNDLKFTGSSLGSWNSVNVSWQNVEGTWQGSSKAGDVATYETPSITFTDKIKGNLSVLIDVDQTLDGPTWEKSTIAWEDFDQSWDGSEDDDAYEMKIFSSISEDGTTFSDFQEFSFGLFEFKAIKFKVMLTALSSKFVLKLTKMVSSIDLPTRQVFRNNIDVGTGGSSVYIAYNVSPNVPFHSSSDPNVMAVVSELPTAANEGYIINFEAGNTGGVDKHLGGRFMITNDNGQRKAGKINILVTGF